MFLNLLNQNDPRSPNANYARELIQLFMMGDYQPPKSTLSPDTKNYTE